MYLKQLEITQTIESGAKCIRPLLHYAAGMDPIRAWENLVKTDDLSFAAPRKIPDLLLRIEVSLIPC
jgi:hypothetical protein